MKSTPSILHVIRSEAWGGLELYVDILVKKLKEQGVHQAVYCMPDSLLGLSLKNANVNILPANKNNKYSLPDIIFIRKLAKSGKYDIIHSHTNVDAWTCAIALIGVKRKHIFSLYMSTMRKRDFVHRLIYKNIDILLSTSENINKEAIENYPIDPYKVQLMRYGRDVENYAKNIQSRADIRKKWNVDDSKCIVGTMCRIDPTKGVKEFASSFLFLPESIRQKTVYWIIGERTVLNRDSNGNIIYEQGSNELYDWLLNFVVQHQLEKSIKIIPFQKDLIGYLSALDLFVLASWHEMYALAVLDALLMKLPVIGTDRGGTPEQLSNNRGLVVPPRSPEEIAKAVTITIENQEQARQMGENGHQWVRQEHDWKNVLARLITLYSKES